VRLRVDGSRRREALRFLGRHGDADFTGDGGSDFALQRKNVFQVARIAFRQRCRSESASMSWTVIRTLSPPASGALDDPFTPRPARSPDGFIAFLY